MSDFEEVLSNLTRRNEADADRRLGAGDQLFAEGHYEQALAVFQSVAAARPDSADAQYRLGLCHWKLGQFDAAKHYFQEAILLAPAMARAHAELSRVMLASADVAGAEKHARRALDLDPQNPEMNVALAAVLEADRRADAASQIVSRLLQAGYASTDLAMIATRLAPKHVDPTQSLSLIDSTISKLGESSPRQSSALQFASANLLDRLGRYDEAFTRATRGNALRGAIYDPQATEQSINEWINFFTAERMDKLAKATVSSDLPVFIVGMPRSGTSLVEQILASHPQVHGAGELDWIWHLVEKAGAMGEGQSPSLQALTQLTPQSADRLAMAYLTPLKSLSPKAARITDKMPTNFLFLGVIAMLFPKARVIHCRRDRRDVCLSCYMTDFAAGHEFSFSLPGVSHFYGQYARIMTHWQSLLKLPIHEVQYETLVENPEPEIRRLVEFVGLEWSDRCLRHFENPRFVGTASVWQARQPIYRGSVGRWKKYAEHLKALG